MNQRREYHQFHFRQVLFCCFGQLRKKPLTGDSLFFIANFQKLNVPIKKVASLLCKKCWSFWKLDELEEIIPKFSFLAGPFLLFWKAMKKPLTGDSLFFIANFQKLNVPIKKVASLLCKKCWSFWKLD